MIHLLTPDIVGTIATAVTGCIAIFKDKEKTLDKAIYAESFRCNKDGGGFAYIDEDRGIVVEKGFFSFDKFYEALKEHEQHPMIVHCRIATHGGVNKENCHPFSFTCTEPNSKHFSFVIAHNGTLPWGSTKDKSDTNCFVHQLLEPHLNRDPYFLDNWIGVLMLEKFIGSHNKLIIMRYNSEKKTYRHYLINKEAGNEAHGCWFSNYSWKVYTQSGYTGPYHGHQGMMGDDWDGYAGGGSSNFPKADKGEDGMYGWSQRNGKWVHSDGTILEKGKKVKPAAVNAVVVSITEGANPPIADGAVQTDGSQKEGQIIPLADGKEIIVPRDAGVITGSQVFVLGHLTQAERKIFHRAAADFLKHENIDLKGKTMQWKAEKFRERIRAIIPGASDLADCALDKWLCQERDIVMVADAKAGVDDSTEQ